MRILDMYPVSDINGLDHPDKASEISLLSPATTIYTDFKVNDPVAMSAGTPAQSVEDLMLKAHVKLILVIDDFGNLVGVVSLQDVKEDRIISEVAAGTRREDVRVRDLMQPRSQLKAFSVSDIYNSTVGEVLATLQHSLKQHCLVIDVDSHRLCGLISASDIARKFRVPLKTGAVVRFSEIYNALAASSGKQNYGADRGV